jgi:hypothetical protein
MAGLLAVFAEFDRDILRSGLARARQTGWPPRPLLELTPRPCVWPFRRLGKFQPALTPKSSVESPHLYKEKY